MLTIIETVGAANANSYETLAEANEYFESRLPLAPPWITSGDTPARALTMSTRLLDTYAQPMRTYVPGQGGAAGYYYTRRRWTGAPASTTQRLAWPRTGMSDRNGNPIAASIIPQELKDAESELAGQLLKTDWTLDLDQVVQGVSSVRAGSVSVSFKENIQSQMIPDAVLNLMPPSWFTEEVIEPALRADFEVL